MAQRREADGQYFLGNTSATPLFGAPFNTPILNISNTVTNNSPYPAQIQFNVVGYYDIETAAGGIIIPEMQLSINGSTPSGLVSLIAPFSFTANVRETVAVSETFPVSLPPGGSVTVAIQTVVLEILPQAGNVINSAVSSLRYNGFSFH